MVAPLQARLSPPALAPCPGPRPRQPGLLHDKRWDIQTTAASDPEIKRGSGQEVEERSGRWRRSLGGEEQCSLRTEQASGSRCAQWLGPGPDGSRPRMTCPLGLPKGAGSQREHFLLLLQRGVLHPVEERVESRLRALAWGMDGEAAAPSPLLLLPAPSSRGPQGSHEVFLGPTGQMPWAPVGGGVWGLVRVPPPLFPPPSPRCG